MSNIQQKLQTSPREDHASEHFFPSGAWVAIQIQVEKVLAQQMTVYRSQPTITPTLIH